MLYRSEDSKSNKHNSLNHNPQENIQYVYQVFQIPCPQHERDFTTHKMDYQCLMPPAAPIYEHLLRSL